MRLGDRGAVTGWAALRLHGGGFFDGLAADGRTMLDVPLALSPGQEIRRGTGFRATREHLTDREVVNLYGVRCTAPLRATFDAMRAQPDARSATVVLDMSLAAGIVRLTDFVCHVAGLGSWPGIRPVRKAISWADGASRSPQESRLRMVWVLDAALPPPRSNVRIYDDNGRFVGTPDLLCEELAVVGEFDGALHRDRDRHRVDVRREDHFRRCGLETFAVVGADLQDVPLVVTRMQAAADRAAAANLPRGWSTSR